MSKFKKEDQKPVVTADLEPLTKKEKAYWDRVLGRFDRDEKRQESKQSRYLAEIKSGKQNIVPRDPAYSIEYDYNNGQLNDTGFDEEL